MTAARDDVASELLAFARFLGGLPRLVRRRMSVAEAMAIVQERLYNRERNFLTVLERVIGGRAVPRAARPRGLHQHCKVALAHRA